MVDWEGAFNVFISGILGVMIVMALLQIFIQGFSAIIRFFEKRKKDNDTKTTTV